MKTKITGILAGATLLAGSAFAEIELSNAGMPKLSLSGWVDSNYVQSSTDGAFFGPEKDTFALSEVEVDFLFDFGGGLTAQFDINYVDGATATNDVQLEQGFFTYAFTEGEDSSLSISAGRFLSYMGWESFDLINLYQQSVGNSSGIASFQDGVRIDYSTDMFSLGAAVVDGLYAGTTSNNNHTELGYELKATFDGIENLTVFVGYSVDQDGSLTGTDDTEAFDVWASYQIGDLLIAAEYSAVTDDNVGNDEDSYLIMANYSVNDWLGFTARYSVTDTELSVGGGNTSEESEYTLAALLKAHDNLGFIIEYRHDEEDLSGDEADTIAIEATLTF
jgi:hypothetical protein